MSKFCRSCGVPLNPNAKFCASCGAKTQGVNQAGTTGIGPPYGGAQPVVQTAKRSNGKSTGRLKKLLIPGVALLVILIALAIVVPRLFDSPQNSAGIDRITGQPYAGRAITIGGEGFGYYDPENCRVTIDGKDTPIISWGENEVTVIVPAGITAGKKKVLLENPPVFNKKSVKTEFLDHKKTELASVTLSPTEDNRIEKDGFTLIVPAGSIAVETKITVYKYDAPSVDESPYYTVTDEYEITGPDGGHVFIDAPVFFGLDVRDEEEAMQSSYQIFDEFEGLWVKAEAVYVEEDGKLYLETSHFSGFRRFVSDMHQGAKRKAGEAVDAGKKGVDYIYKGGKAAKDAVVKIGEETWVAIKDATVETFVGVSDANNNFIIYYRVADAKSDPSIPNMAREMAAAFSTAYDEYKALFGEKNVPSTKRVVFSWLGSAPKIVPDPIKVYIDPRYNKTGAVAKSATTGNIIMPSEFSHGDVASTCAHELFHVVQYHQLGFKQLYMGNRLKDIDGSLTGGSPEVYRIFSDNKWFLEATAEYAGRFIGTDEGVGNPIHQSIDATRPYYAINGFHDYGISSFLDYIVTSRQTDENAQTRREGFKALWNTVTGNYSLSTDINTALDGYVRNKLSSSTQSLYEDFWRDAFTRSYMPEAKLIAGGLRDVLNLSKDLNKAIKMTVMENGVGIFRYSLTSASVPEDETALTRSFWLKASPVNMLGDVYRLDSLAATDRIPGEPPYEGAVNLSDTFVRDVLVPYSAGDSIGLVSVFKSVPAKSAELLVTISSTSLKWDNQKDIEKKVGDATLKGSDKLKFTPVLPEQKAGDPPFTAVVTINNSDDYKTEIDKVENGKSFEVSAPMKELPPDKVSVNIKIFRDRKLVHEYQSGELEAEVTVYISGPRDTVVELTKEDLPYEHHFTAKAWPAGEYRFSWSFGNGFSEDTRGREESAVSAAYPEFKKYTTTVTLYDLNGKELASHDVTLTLKEKDPAATAVPPDPPKAEKTYAWVLVETLDFENADKWAAADAHESYAVSHSYAPGSYSASTTYEGKDYDGRGLAGTLALQATFTGIPNVIYPDKPVSINLSFTTTQNNVVKLAFAGAASAIFDQWDVEPGGVTRGAIYFANADGKDHFTLDVNGNPSSYNEMLTASLGTGREEGDRIALRTGFFMGTAMGTNYVYEWKQVGESAPFYDTEGIPGIVDID